MSTSDVEDSSAPWQPLFAGAALFTVAGIHFVSALNFLLDLSDWAGLKATLPDWQAISDRLATATAEEIYEWLLLCAYVFATLGMVFMLLGILMWRGQSRHGVRLISTIVLVISWLGALRLVFTPDGGGTGTGPSVNALFLVVITVGLIGVLTLWFGAGSRWIRRT